MRAAVAGAATLAFGVSDGARAGDCKDACFSNCYAEFAIAEAGCSNDFIGKLEECDSWWYWVTHTAAEIRECRFRAKSENDLCVSSAGHRQMHCYNDCFYDITCS
jgi:hypothetical protein